MSQLELAEKIDTELERNPVLEPAERPIEKDRFHSREPQIAAKITLRDHLLRRMRDTVARHGRSRHCKISDRSAR